MFGMQTIDVAIGLVFIYLLLALICTGINELIAGWLDRRTKNLEIGIHNLLFEKNVTLIDPKDNVSKDLKTLLFNHPMIRSLKEDGTNPSYIPPRVFALAVLDILVPTGIGGAKTVADIKNAVAALPATSDVRRTMMLILDQAGEDIQKVQTLVEMWFNDTMDRIAAWYKNKTQGITILLALLITVFAGADTFEISKSLLNDPAVRTAVVTQAQQAVKNMPAPPAATPPEGTPAPGPKAPSGVAAAAKTTEANLKENITTLNGLGLKLGWQGKPSDGWPSKVIGLLITTFAVFLGAPFWFDLLNRFISIRAVGKSPAEKEKAAQPGCVSN